MDLKDTIKNILEGDIKGFIKNGDEYRDKNGDERVFPPLYPYSSKTKNENLSSTFRTGDDGEKKLYEALKEFMTNNEDKEWFIFHSIGKAFKKWLQKPQKKDFFDQLLKEAKKKAQENGPEIKEGFDPDK
jgi:hypothetical protein